jgi:hypothetical protein
MHRIGFLVLLVSNTVLAQRTQHSNTVDTTTSYWASKTIRISIERKEQTSPRGSEFQTYNLKVFNDSTVPVCIAYSSPGGYPINEQSYMAFCLDRFGSDTLHYIDLLIPEDICKMDVEAYPVAPIVLFPNTYFSTNIEFRKVRDGKKVRIAVPYQVQNINFSEVAAFNQGRRRYVHINERLINYKTVVVDAE